MLLVLDAGKICTRMMAIASWHIVFSNRICSIDHPRVSWMSKLLRILRECLCKSGPVDFACFLCVVRHSCTYTKTTISLIGSLYFSEFSLEQRLVVTLFKTLISYNFGGQFTKNYGTQKKTTTTAMYIDFILSIEATFANITFQSRKQEDLNDTLWDRLNHTRQNRSNSR